MITALLLGAIAANAAPRTIGSDGINLYDINVNVDEQRREVTVGIMLDVARFRVGSEREIILTPVLESREGGDSIVLDNIIVAGRNRWFHYLRDNMLEGDDVRIYRAGTGRMAKIEDKFPLEPWMGKSELVMRAAEANCCDAPVNLVGPSPTGGVPLARIDLERPDINAPFRFAPPVDEGPVIKSIEGSAFVTFVVNRTELKADYMKNRSELDKIINSIEYVLHDSDATITGVHIKGFASPEGPYDNNVRLAQGRTETLRRYVRDLYSFKDSVVTSSYEPEDWGGLRSYVADSMDYPITHRKEILAIIDGPLGLDDKNAAIQRQFPADYAVLLKEIYPWLRRSDYKVTYSIKIYTDIEDIRRIYKEDPTKLRNVDFYTLAYSYPEGSDDYYDVLLKGVEVYPDDPMLNLNAANIEMGRGNLDRAQLYLLKSGKSPLAAYARGVLASKRMMYDEAIGRFNEARAGGIEGVDSVIAKVKEQKDFYPVTYLIELNK